MLSGLVWVVLSILEKSGMYDVILLMLFLWVWMIMKEFLLLVIFRFGILLLRLVIIILGMRLFLRSVEVVLLVVIRVLFEKLNFFKVFLRFGLVLKM